MGLSWSAGFPIFPISPDFSWSSQSLADTSLADNRPSAIQHHFEASWWMFSTEAPFSSTQELHAFSLRSLPGAQTWQPLSHCPGRISEILNIISGCHIVWNSLDILGIIHNHASSPDLWKTFGSLFNGLSMALRMAIWKLDPHGPRSFVARSSASGRWVIRDSSG